MPGRLDLCAPLGDRRAPSRPPWRNGGSVAAMRSLLALAIPFALATAACGKGGASSKITAARLEQAKKLVAAPQPLTDIRPRLVELLGEPTATDGEDLYWAVVSGSECHYMQVVVQGGTVNGTTGGMAHEAVAEPFAKCAVRAGRK
jgi:hypothetical protein